jgi:hypothetical protein
VLGKRLMGAALCRLLVRERVEQSINGQRSQGWVFICPHRSPWSAYHVQNIFKKVLCRGDIVLFVFLLQLIISMDTKTARHTSYIHWCRQ